MLQPLPQRVPPSLPNLNRTIRMSYFPDSMQTRMSKANDAEEVVEEMCERTPAEVRMLRWMIVSLENPVRWDFRNKIPLRLVVA
jgi:hypothetical protein